jgi:MoaA/NifB/PqqE/SkfB family radical SAM enzyme
MIERNQQIGEKFRKNIFFKPTEKEINIQISTSGELFGSPMLLSFVNSIPVNDFPNVKLSIQTNGLLAERAWDKLGAMKDHVHKITVTTDAARPNTYEQLRRGGRWEDIQQALKWISNKKKDNGMQFNLRMVVQYSNYQEMLEFYQQAQSLGVDVVEYSRIANWATYSSAEFAHHDVFSDGHPEKAAAERMLEQIKVLPNVFLNGGL